MSVSLLLPLLFVGGALSHSWIACTDYLQENGDYWGAEHCRAFARHGHQFTPKDNFGIDTGYNFNGISENRVCRTTRNDAQAYNNDYPMAVYFPGQKVVIAHPTKNHVAEICTNSGYNNRYIPDHGNYIYRSPVNPSQDPTYTTFLSYEVADLGISPFGHDKSDAEITTYPKPGYQNAPRFCENNDKALATYAFYIPPNLQPGRYTFLWTWSFNGPQDTYSSCWEADVVATRTDRDNVLRSRGQVTIDPVVFHGRSLPVPPDGIPNPPPAPATTAAPPATTTAPPAPTAGPPAPGGTTRRTVMPAPTTSRPGTGVPASLLCVDTCLRQCYNP